MNSITKLVAPTIAGLILATLITVGLLIGAGHAHAGSSTHTFAMSYIERGRHGGRS